MEFPWFDLCVGMETVVKPEPVCSQTVLDEMKREPDAMRFPAIKEEILNSDMQNLQLSMDQDNADNMELPPISHEGNGEIKTKMDAEEHRILEDSSECISSHTRSRNTRARKCGEIIFNTDKPDHTGANPLTGGGSFKCDLCGKCFTRRNSLTAHIRTHTGDKPFKCEVCSKRFTQRSTLTMHIRTHNGDKPFQCEVCSKCFTDRSNFTSHIRTHTGDKPFKCKVCSKCFTQHSNLMTHIRTHNGDKPFKCDVCCRCFTQRYTLTRHIRTHTEDKLFKC